MSFQCKKMHANVQLHCPCDAANPSPETTFDIHDFGHCCFLFVVALSLTAFVLSLHLNLKKMTFYER